MTGFRSQDTLVTRGVRLSLGGSIYDPADPMSKMFFNMLAVFAGFEADLLKVPQVGRSGAFRELARLTVLWPRFDPVSGAA
jgi:hypothetical protein